jgi:hypothetical protein
MPTLALVFLLPGNQGGSASPRAERRRRGLDMGRREGHGRGAVRADVANLRVRGASPQVHLREQHAEAGILA